MLTSVINSTKVLVLKPYLYCHEFRNHSVDLKHMDLNGENNRYDKQEVDACPISN